ncbi:MAG: hypothetical protein WKG01_16045, partial [Kofleriaceae bacterium]
DGGRHALGILDQHATRLDADHVLIYKRADRGMAVTDGEAIPSAALIFLPGMSVRFDASCANPTMVNSLTVISRMPFDQKSTYVVALKRGIKTAAGADFNATFTWSLVRNQDNPVTVVDGDIVADSTPLNPGDPEDRVTLLGVDQLWRAHTQAMTFLRGKGHATADIILAWEFNTQTTTEPLDPAVAGSPAADVATTPLLGNQSLPAAINRANPPYNQCVVGDNPTQCFLKISLGKGDYAIGDARCAALGCAAINDVIGSALMAKQYQIDTPNPYTGAGAKPIPGPWGDPVKPAFVKDEAIQVLSLVPVGTPPAGGWPTVIFQHGLGQSKTNVFAIGGRLASLGFASVAIDAVAHDSRAVRISDDPARLCADASVPAPTPGGSPQCYAPFLSPNLGATRDGIRQTVVDHQRLIAALKACGTASCADLKVDAAHIMYMGQSLGGILGSMTVAVRDDITAGVLNVPGVGWADILENTQTLPIRCSLVNGLIDAGILVGDKWSPAAPTVGLCTTDAWKAQPGYRQFSVIARWVLDPADPANFARKLATRTFLIQEVVGDTVVPNVATENEAALVGLMGMTADRFFPPGEVAPSAAITTNPMASKFVRYPTLPAGANDFPGNTFAHGSLLSPAAMTPAGQFATGRMQTDALTFLSLNQ